MKAFLEYLSSLFQIFQMTKLSRNVVKRDDHYLIKFVSILAQLQLLRVFVVFK